MYRTIRAASIFQKFTLGLLDNFGEENVNGGFSTLDVKPSMTIHELKTKCYYGEAGRLYLVQNYWLKESKKVELTTGTLADCNVSHRSLLHYKLNRMGGSTD